MGARASGLLLVLLLVPACGRQNRPVVAVPAGGGPAPAAESAVSWTRDVWPILNVRCRVCHTTGSGAQEVPDMTMSDSAALYLRWVNVASQCNPNLFRVIPRNSGLSFVFDKISKPAPLCGQRMPLIGPPLEDEEQRTIRDWIDQGARHN